MKNPLRVFRDFGSFRSLVSLDVVQMLVFQLVSEWSTPCISPPRTAKAMTLRIQKSTEHERLVFQLSGRIRGDQLAGLRALLTSEIQGHNLVLDLKEVKLVDRDTVRFLAQSEAEGVRLRNCSAFIREWILQERKAIRRAEAKDPGVQQE
jgi:anti-anti-sigma regulatory factor